MDFAYPDGSGGDAAASGERRVSEKEELGGKETGRPKDEGPKGPGTEGRGNGEFSMYEINVKASLPEGGGPAQPGRRESVPPAALRERGNRSGLLCRESSLTMGFERLGLMPCTQLRKRPGCRGCMKTAQSGPIVKETVE